ncbi:HAD-like domain-containing protein [Macrophomina phaseolina]|uniref:HAD-like domain-containing protein n=1 Tax=Macrophomina phaseolina TaxID=35725 RepID=A0ABQ8GMU0_9PEZI|nr:HAD-like domain-containing protein [Macrophomina phaseolina]
MNMTGERFEIPIRLAPPARLFPKYSQHVHHHPPKPQPTLIIFDLLTALLDSWTAWDTAVSTALSQNPPNPSTATPSPHTLGRAWRQNYLHLTYTTGSYTPYAALVHAAATLTPDLPPTAPSLLLSNYTEWLAPWPEVPAILRELRARGYRLAVATNCSKELGHAAARLCGGGENVFDVVVTAEESGWYKPAREAYAAVLREAEVRADEALFVAGSAADVPGAAGAGLRVVWHNRVGMDAKGEARAEREGRTLVEVLEGDVL